MKRWSLSPRSLRQLVTMAFLLVLLPLLVLAWQAWHSLNVLSEHAARTNRTTLVDARRSEMMSAAALEMERSYRQYCVLDDATLSRVYLNQRQRYISLLDAQDDVVAQPAITTPLRDHLNKLARLVCSNNSPTPEASAHLEAFARYNSQLVQATRSEIAGRGLKLQQQIAKRGQFFGWQALVLFLVSLGLVLLFTRMIIGPVKALGRMINRLGEGEYLERDLSFSGPRELRFLAQRIIWLSDRLGWLEAQRHQFLRHLSHELKTPLASLREGTDLLADEVVGPLSAEQRAVVEILDTSSRNLQTLIEQLLDYNRRLSGQTTAPQKVELPPVIDAIQLAHQLPARAKNMRTEMSLKESFCQADPELLRTALDNLYSNAVYYGEESGTIYLCSQREGNWVYIDVANTGQPIPEAERAMIFEPFYQGRLQRKGAVKGSGLGLSIAQDCVARMQGKLSLTERPDAAVCFRIALPVFNENQQP
ncbi:two-component sensor histidine kinase [Salmonella enterica subsp. enterica serovar Choleraesuis]|nr:two-component sensor histidine kinase [Salmonella enterica subsp. enterica serovar Choleraesuis]